MKKLAKLRMNLSSPSDRGFQMSSVQKCAWAIGGFIVPLMALGSPNTGLPLLIGFFGVLTFDRSFWREIPTDLMGPLFVLILWGLISSYWSINPSVSFKQGLKLLVILGLGLNWLSFCLRATENEAFLQGMMGGLILLTTVIIIDFQLDYPFVHLVDRGAIRAYVTPTILITLSCYPICLWIKEKNGISYASAMFIIIVMSLLSVDIDVSIVALALGGMALAVTYVLSPKILGSLLKIGFAAILLFLPLCMGGLTPEVIQSFNRLVPVFSYIHRLHIWRYISQKSLQDFFWGYGLGTAKLGALNPNSYTWTFIEKTGQQSQHAYELPLKPLFYHPHNMILQTWLEMGFVGVLILGFFFWRLFSRVTILPLRERLLSVGYITVLLTFSFVAVDLFHTCWLSIVFLGTGIVILVNKTQPA